MAEIPDPNGSKKSMSGATLGIQLAVGMAVFSYAGYWLDQQAGEGQMWLLAGMFCGIFYCMYEIWKLVKKGQREEESNE